MSKGGCILALISTLPAYFKTLILTIRKLSKASIVLSKDYLSLYTVPLEVGTPFDPKHVENYF